MDSVRDGERMHWRWSSAGLESNRAQTWRLEPVQVYATARLDPTGSRKRPQWGEKASVRFWPGSVYQANGQIPTQSGSW